MLILGVLLVALTVLGVESRIAEELMHKEEAPATTRKYLSVEESAAFFSSGCFHASRKHCPVDQHCRRLLHHAMLCCDVDAASVKEALSPERMHISFLFKDWSVVSHLDFKVKKTLYTYNIAMIHYYLIAVYNCIILLALKYKCSIMGN